MEYASVKASRPEAYPHNSGWGGGGGGDKCHLKSKLMPYDFFDSFFVGNKKLGKFMRPGVFACNRGENKKWGFQDKMDHFCRQNRSNPPQSFLQSSLELNHHLSVYRMSQIIQLALT